MPTTNQMVRKGRKKKRRKPRINPHHLDGNPHMRAVVLRATILNPRKPNSADRKVARVKLRNGKEVSAYFPGQYMHVREHDTVLIEPGRTPDLPGYKYRIIPGVLDAPKDPERKNRRSRFGTKKR